MRKILLGTTAVVGAALIGVGSAQAQQAPTVRIGGYFDFSGAYVSDNADRSQVVRYDGSLTGRDRYDFRSDAEIQVFVTAKAANGLSYGATIELQVDNVGVGGPGTAVDTDEMYGFISSPTFGQLRFGDEDSAANLMQVRAPFLATASPAGRWTEFVQHNGAIRYMVTSINDGGDRTKVVYMSPQFFGFDFGVSFAPNTGEGERERLGLGVTAAGQIPVLAQLQRERLTTRNEVTGALRYRGSFGNVGFAAGVAATRADAPTGPGIIAIPAGSTGLQDPWAVAVGAQLTAFGFTVGGEYLWGKYNVNGPGGVAPTGSGRGTSHTYAFGGTYTAGPVAVGAFYGFGKNDTSLPFNGAGAATPRGDRTQTVWGIGLEYTIAPGLVGYAQYNNVSDTNLEAPTGNRRNGDSRSIDAVIVGVNLAF